MRIAVEGYVVAFFRERAWFGKGEGGFGRFAG